VHGFVTMLAAEKQKFAPQVLGSCERHINIVPKNIVIKCLSLFLGLDLGLAMRVIVPSARSSHPVGLGEDTRRALP
jgi:hypothetical protein